MYIEPQDSCCCWPPKNFSLHMRCSARIFLGTFAFWGTSRGSISDPPWHATMCFKACEVIQVAVDLPSALVWTLNNSKHWHWYTFRISSVVQHRRTLSNSFGLCILRQRPGDTEFAAAMTKRKSVKCWIRHGAHHLRIPYLLGPNLIL